MAYPFSITHLRPDDHPAVISVIADWWSGRDLTHLLPRLFFDHFSDSSYVVRDEGELVAFLIAFLSQSIKDMGYIHFIGVHPSFRKQGLGAHLYERFFDFCRSQDRHLVKSCTSPVNKGSIEFHRRMGFTIVAGDAQIDGVDVQLDYNRPDDPKVIFLKKL